MKTLGDFLHGLALKAGMSPENEDLKNFLLNGELLKINVPEEVEKGIDNKLLSVKEARNNHPEIRTFYFAQALDVIDKMIEGVVAEADFDDKTKSTLAPKSFTDKNTQTYQRLGELFQLLKTQKKEAPTKGEKDTIQKQIDDLHAQVAVEKTKSDNLKKQFDSDLLKYKKESKIDSMLSAYKTIYDDLDPDVKRIALKAIINKDLQDNRADFAFDDKENFILLNEDGTNFFGDNHQQKEPKSYIEQILSRNKLLKVTDQSSNGQGDKSHKPPPQGGSGNSTRNATHEGLVHQAIKDLENASAVTIM